MPVPTVVLSNVTLLRRGRRVLHDFSLSIADDEHWAFVSDEDATASLLLNVIAGRELPAQGTISIEAFKQEYTGHVASHYHFRSLSPTENYFYQVRFNMSGEEDAETVRTYLDRKLKHARSDHWNIDSVSDYLLLDSIMDKQLVLLSNGETRRLMLAATLIQNPKLLLLDHPQTGLDPDMRSRLTALVTELIKSGTQVILSTSPEEIPDSITKVGVIKDGKLISVYDRIAFDPEILKPQALSIDEDKLNSLLQSNHEAYDIIVGMTKVNVRYGDNHLLRDIDWQVKKGERWVIRGHNGAGKSTLLSLINGDNPQAYANEITLFDHPKGRGQSIWTIKRNIGYVSPELFKYFPLGQSCVDVIESGLYDTVGMYRKNDPANRPLISDWMELLGIKSAIDRQMSEVSLATQRLCLLARALIKNPVLLILDEPCEGLDRNQQYQFVQLIDAICKVSDVTLIYVSHYEDQIPRCVSRRLILEDGRVKEQI